jgi:hypothetical protein
MKVKDILDNTSEVPEKVTLLREAKKSMENDIKVKKKDLEDVEKKLYKFDNAEYNDLEIQKVGFGYIGAKWKIKKDKEVYETYLINVFR